MIDYYEWLILATEKNQADPEVGKITMNDLTKMAQVEQLHRIANALEELVQCIGYWSGWVGHTDE